MIKTYDTWQEATREEFNKHMEYLGQPYKEPDLTALSDRQIMILRLRFVDGLTLHAIGERIGVSAERVRQLIWQAMGDMLRPEKVRKWPRK